MYHLQIKYTDSHVWYCVPCALELAEELPFRSGNELAQNEGNSRLIRKTIKNKSWKHQTDLEVI